MPGCGGSPASPSSTTTALTLVAETSTFNFFAASSDTLQIERVEAFHTWAVARLGVTLPRRIDYRKYLSRQHMGDLTGRYNSNGFAEPAAMTVHTLWPWDNHEVVHVYTALIGRPSAFFEEGIAVAMQTDPMNGVFDARFNGEPLHAAASRYRSAGQLVLPLTRIVQTESFRAVADQVLSYRQAGSFVGFLLERYGMDRVQQLFRTNGAGDSVGVILARFQAAFGVTLEEAEAAWLEFLP